MNFLKTAKPILDKEVVSVLEDTKIFNNSDEYPVFFYNQQFIKNHRQWISKSKNFKIENLDEFTNAYVTFGNTDAFNDFYFLHKKVYVLKGEYAYHQKIGVKVLDHIGLLDPYSALIISYPFSASGKVHPDWDKIIEFCTDRHCQVFLDLSFFGISCNQHLVIPECVTHVAFSFSKMFCTGSLRTGVLYTRYKNNTPLHIQNHHMYTNHIGTVLHNKLMQNFSPDWIIDKYLQPSKTVCKNFGLEESDTIIFGLGSSPDYDDYSREAIVNRVCISREIQKLVM